MGSTPHPGLFANYTAEELINVCRTNIIPVTLLSRYFMQRMKNQGIKGLIINNSSCLEAYPVPYGAIYAASKAFTRSLTKSLQYEAKPWGIEVQLLSPAFLVTKINSYSSIIMRGNWFIPGVRQYVRSAVKTIGKVNETTGYLSHAVQVS